MITNDILIRWFLNENLVTHAEASITSLPPSEPQTKFSHQSNLFLESLTLSHYGNWTCSALVDTGAVQNQTVSVLVISHATVLCPSTVTNTSKGHYTWGVTLAGLSATNLCTKSSTQQPSVVEYMCDTNGKWGILNDSQCAHTSDVTDKLYRFAHMNNSDFDQNTLVQSAKRLLQFTGQADQFLDGMDIVYLSSVLENYVPYLHNNHELASLCVDIASDAMKMNREVILQGQLFSHAATRLMATISNISRIVPAFQHHRSNLAVEGFKVSPLSFGGITCSWYSESLQGSGRMFYCSENNKTAPSMGRHILGSVQLPSTLYYQLQLLERDINTAKNIIFSAFNNDTLFPQVPSSKDSLEPEYEVISSCIIGSTVVAVEAFNLSEPVYVILKLRAGAAAQPQPVPAWWDPRANTGLGAWQPGYCRMMKARRDRAVFSCHRLGYYALLGDLSSKRRPRAGQEDLTSSTHPAVYAGTAVALICLVSTVFVFVHLFTSINMTKKLKHSLPNLWLSVTFLLVFHVLGGELVSDKDLCRITGLLIHYFTLTSSLWLTISSSIIYRKLVNPMEKPVRHINPYVVTPEEEVYIGVGDGKKYKKPMARFYLVGWGVPLIICGITGGASLSQYSSSGSCFLSLAPAAGAILIPIVIIFTIHFFFLFNILTFLPHRLISQVDNIFLSEYRQDSQTSLCSESTVLVPDRENSHRSHGYALLAVSLLLLGILFSSFMSVASPLTSFDEETHHNMFDTLYAVLASTLGITILSYYCLLRQDIPICRLPHGCSKPDETSNLVNLTPNNLSMIPRAAKLNNLPPQQNTLQPPAFQLVDLGGSVLGPSSGRLKQCNIERESEGSSEYHSVNNAAHLRRPLHLPPITIEGMSDADVTDIMFSSKMKVNNVNIHVSEGPDKVNWVECPGKEDWSTHSQHSFSGQKTRYSSSPRHGTCAEESSQLLLTNSRSFLSGATTAADPDPESHSTRQRSAHHGKLVHSRDHLPASTSLPRRYGRRHKYTDRRQISGRQQMSTYSDIERAEVCSSSKLSEISSSTAYSARSAGSKARSKKNKPRRKPRKRSEIFPESTSTKRSNTNYDPIMELSSKFDEENSMLVSGGDDPSMDVTNQATIQQAQSPSSRNMLAEDAKSDEEESSDNIRLVSQLASRDLSSKETCV